MPQYNNEPIIFIGMHRSGTSLLGRLLEQLGLFVGARKDENNESLFFLKINEWLMSQCGARWDHPGPISDLWSEDAVPALSAATGYINDLLSSPRSAEYLGIKKYIQFRSVDKILSPWGWKDPRNTFTLPFWLKIFPDAKVIFIERHGVDVAESLRYRTVSSVETLIRRYERTKPFGWVRLKEGGFSDSPRCLTLEGGFSLWESYQEQAERHIRGLARDKILRIRYEDLLFDPVTILGEAAAFAGLPARGAQIRSTTKFINSDRAYSYLTLPRLKSFADIHRERLEKWGYDV